MLRPKILSTLREYTRDQFRADVTSGMIVGVVALPLCIAFAIASGVSPERGLITGIVAGFFISAFGGSRVQIGGPAGAFIVIVAGIVNEFGLEGLITATLLSGIVLVIMGLAGLGSIIKFIPQPVITGFTSGIAVIIFSSQFPDLLGLTIPDLPGAFLEKWSTVLPHVSELQPTAFVIAGLTLLIMINWPKVTHRIPGSLVALILTTALAHYFQWDVETIGSRYGQIPSAIPTPVLPDLSLDVLRHLVQPVMAISILVAIESLLSAVVADGMIGDRHHSSMELVGQGVANFASALFGGMPATGAIARTMTNIRNGGSTPVAGIVHALTLLLITLVFARWAAWIPLACLAAILAVIAFHMFEWRSFLAMLRSQRGEMLVMLTTFALTVLIDLTVAIEVGMVLAAFLFMKRMSEVTNVAVLRRELSDDAAKPVSNTLTPSGTIPKGVEVYEINGPFFFGAVYKFKEAMNIVEKSPKVRIIRMAHVSSMDTTGLRALEEVHRDGKKHGTELIIAEIHAQPFVAMMKSDLVERFGEQNVLATFDEALARAQHIVSAQDSSAKFASKRAAEAP